MAEVHESLILLCHRGDWEHRYQAAAAAAAATSSGQEVRLVLFFAALDRWLDDAWSQAPDPDRLYRGVPLAERVEEVGVAAPAELITVARRSGRCRVLACSASLALIGAEPEEARASVDEIVGWPTILQLMRAPARVLYL